MIEISLDPTDIDHVAVVESARYAATRWRALGSNASLVVADQEQLPAAKLACLQILDQVDLACSRFRDDSDLTRASRGAGGWVAVDPLLICAMTDALRAAEATDGLVDPTLSGPLVALGGADRRGRRRPVAGEPGGWREIELDPDGGIRVPRGLRLDLGATGKAFAADLIAAAVPRLAETSLIISLGGDVAVGSWDAEHPWAISVAERPEESEPGRAEVVVLAGGGLATSSTLTRRWEWTAGSERGHRLDPGTAGPVDGLWRTASVCAESCVDASAASAATIVMGADAPRWLRERDLAARLVGLDGSVTRIAGWPVPSSGRWCGNTPPGGADSRTPTG